MDVCEKLNVIVTGGKDGGISLWPLHVDNKNVEIAFSDELNFKHTRDVPRRLILAKSGNLLTTTNEGKLLVYSGATWQYVHSDHRFSSYCLFEISPSKTYFSWASLRGDVKIFEGNFQLIPKPQSDEECYYSFSFFLQKLGVNRLLL